MRILTIGNSFSDDATSLLHQAAATQGISIDAENLYIGGCSLEQHFFNIKADKAAYTLEFNGFHTPHMISIKEALTDCVWDVITVQQASHFSAFYETYQPYLNELVTYIRSYQPKAKVLVHQTWAYEEGSERLRSQNFPTRAKMFAAVKASYAKAASDCGADGLIPSGELFEKLAENGLRCHRDTFHAALGAGRYALALLWIKALTGSDISANSFRGMEEAVSEEEITKIKQAVNAVAEQQV